MVPGLAGSAEVAVDHDRADDDHHHDHRSRCVDDHVDVDTDPDDLTVRRILPLGLLALTTIVVQVAFMPHLRFLGVVPDLGLVLAIAIAYHDDAETAAIVGFVTGLGFDLFLRTPVGVSALAYAVTGYVTGVIQASLIRSSRWLPFVLGGLGGLVGGLLFVGIAILAGTDSLIHLTTVGIVARAALYDAIAALVMFPLVERFVRTRVGPPVTWRE